MMEKNMFTKRRERLDLFRAFRGGPGAGEGEAGAG